MASDLLEAFVYDPLLNWRLLDSDKNRRSKTNTDGNIGSLNGSVDDAFNLFLSNQNAKLKQFDATQGPQAEVTNKKARSIVDRVKQKLTGNDFNTQNAVTVQQQVDLLIQQATNNENLCQCYIGWCPFW